MKPDVIEDALRSYPLAELPPGFSKQVMRQVRAHPSTRASRVPAGFRLTWLDYALGMFLSLLAGAAYILWNLVPKEMLLRLHFEWSLFQQPRVENLLLASFAVAAALLLAGVLVGLRVLSGPRPRPL